MNRKICIVVGCFSKASFVDALCRLKFFHKLQYFACPKIALHASMSCSMEDVTDLHTVQLGFSIRIIFRASDKAA